MPRLADDMLASLLSFALVLTLAASPAPAEDLSLELSVEGELTPELRAALAKLLDPTSAEAEWPDFLSTLRYNQTNDYNHMADYNFPSTLSYNSPDDYKYGDYLGARGIDFTATANNDTFVEFGPVPDAWDPPAITGPSSGGGAVAASVIANDLATEGFSSRRIRLPDSVAPEALEAVRVAALAQGATASVVPGTFKPQIDIDLQNVAMQQRTAGAACGQTPQPGWPYDVDALAKVLAFNDAVIAKLSLPGPRRVKVNVMDTGAGEIFTRADRLRDYVHYDLGAGLHSQLYLSGTDLAGSAPRCAGVYPLRTDYTTNAFGYFAAADSSLCTKRDPERQIAPISNPANADHEHHGSAVAILAIGGEASASGRLSVARNIGLTFSRVFRTPLVAQSAGAGIEADKSDLVEALKAAATDGSDIINASFIVNNRDFFTQLSQALSNNGFAGLMVAAAGNNGPSEITGNSHYFPAAADASATPSGIRAHEQLVVVAALAPPGQPDGAPTLWDHSNRSPDLVDIAAPGVDIPSLNADGAPICMSGTSGAAPLVTFAGALAESYGLVGPAETRRRLLATADEISTLVGTVNGGRVLNIPRAADVYVDLLWLDGIDKPPHRVVLKPNVPGFPQSTLIKACSAPSGPLDDTSGFVDANMLISWEKDPAVAGNASLSYKSASFTRQVVDCVIPADVRLEYFDVDAGAPGQVALADVTKLVPSPLRSAALSLLPN